MEQTEKRKGKSSKSIIGPSRRHGKRTGTTFTLLKIPVFPKDDGSSGVGEKGTADGYGSSLPDDTLPKEKFSGEKRETQDFGSKEANGENMACR